MSLKAQPGGDEIGRTRRSRWEPGGLPKESRGQRMNICVCNPVAATDVQTQEIRVQLLAVGEKMAHVYGSCSSSKQSNGMEERRECQDPLRFRQPTSENDLQDNASHQPYESK